MKLQHAFKWAVCLTRATDHAGKGWLTAFSAGMAAVLDSKKKSSIFSIVQIVRLQ